MKSLKTVKKAATVFVLSAGMLTGLSAGLANAAPAPFPLDHHGHGGGGGCGYYNSCGGGGGYGGYGVGDPITAGINLGTAIVGLVTAGIQAAPPPQTDPACWTADGQPYWTGPGLPC